VTAASIAARLGGRKSGTGYVAKCVEHEDRTPSLSLNDSRDGKVLVHCHAGCDQGRVIQKLKDLGLWPDRENVDPGLHSRAFNPDKPIVARYDYTDAHGNPLYQVVRFEPKNFRPRYPDGRGGWIWKKHPDQVLYRLREVVEAPIVFVVEGEKDVETLRAHGFVATTAAGGAKAPWLPQFTEALRGREVLIIPDNDPPGWDAGPT
jgi:hypothetical protein